MTGWQVARNDKLEGYQRGHAVPHIKSVGSRSRDSGDDKSAYVPGFYRYQWRIGIVRSGQNVFFVA